MLAAGVSRPPRQRLGLVRAGGRTVPCQPSGFRAAETMAAGSLGRTGAHLLARVPKKGAKDLQVLFTSICCRMELEIQTARTAKEVAMFGDFRHRLHRRGELIHNTVEGVFLSATTLLFTLLTLVILYFVVFLSRAA